MTAKKRTPARRPSRKTGPKTSRKTTRATPPKRSAKPKAQTPVALDIASVATVGSQVADYCASLAAANDSVMTDCNAFVKKVGAKFGVAIPKGNADAIVAGFGSAPFTKTTTDPAEAMGWAANGLVAAGMTLAALNPTYGTKYTNGHVAIVHATEVPGHPGFPQASWGLLNGVGQAVASIRDSFPYRACDDHAVQFAFAEVTV